eukprot:CAMPEP_0119331858 /NCGR_PEP_ID=MMETSP1333-20130426/81537_1 /TAXON_ID=418940 /ORGANISM="Scyphosphaera apsteinii, Strain RCC1455" /LENGTH=46 /DNA_ID= /DNA_START= /DNA_END= /DNA_ORIENTATION=
MWRARCLLQLVSSTNGRGALMTSDQRCTDARPAVGVALGPGGALFI